MTQHKPVMDTMLNTAAIAISAFGVLQVQNGQYKGLLLVGFAAALEFLKYWGRKNKYW